jgi:energy-coupling factor transport system ATP-binding protein
MLTKVGIDASFYQRSPFELSGGERRRVAIAGILALRPQVLILDEPTAGLDPQGAKVLMGIFKQLHQQGMTIILVTHDMNLVYAFAEEVIVMDQGKVTLQAATLDLFNQTNLPVAIAVPQLVALVYALQARGMKLDIRNIRTFDDLVREVKRAS